MAINQQKRSSAATTITTNQGKSNMTRQAGSTTKVRPKKPIKVNHIQPLIDKPDNSVITREMIARKAYNLWQNRGGSADFNWYEAERILRGE